MSLKLATLAAILGCMAKVGSLIYWSVKSPLFLTTPPPYLEALFIIGMFSFLLTLYRKQARA